MASSNPARTTVCITEAFGFLDDPDYDKESQVLKKSTSDTNLFINTDNKFDNLQARIRSLSNKGQELDNDSYTSQSDASYTDQSKASLLRKKNDTYTIITYLGDENTRSDRHIHDSGIGTDDLDVSDNFTIVTYIDDQPKLGEKYDSDEGSESLGKGDNKIIKGNNEETKQGNDVDFSLKDCIINEIDLDRNIDLGIDYYERDKNQVVQQVGDIGDSDSHVIGRNQSDNIILQNENEVVMRHISGNSDDERQPLRGSDEVVMRRQSTSTDESRSRRTQQIVSDAFYFLKDLEYCDPDAVSSYSLSLHDDSNIDLNISDLQTEQSCNVPNIEQIDMSSPMSAILSSGNKKVMVEHENSTDELARTNESEFSNVSTEKVDEEAVLMRRQQFRRQSKESASQDDCTDDSSDEDTGIYNESFRNSCWLKVDDNMSLSSVQESLEDDNYEPSTTDDQSDAQPSNQNDKKQNKDEVFLETHDSSHDYRGHNRSDSVTTTLSEREFKKQYNFRRKCLVKRNDSQQEYHRLSAKIYENEKVIIIQKSLEDKDFGLHIIDSHPAIITDVDKGSPAHKAGVRQGQILITVNGVSVLESNHDEIINLVQQDPSLLKIEVANSNVHYIRDLQTPLQKGYMYKQSTSALIKTWRRRYFILRHDNCLYYYKNEQDEDPLGAIPLLNYTVSRHQDNHRDYCFKAEKYQAKTYYFAAENREQLTKWVGAMNEAAMLAKKRKDSWMDVTSHNVGLPALHIRKPECCGYLNKASRTSKNFRRRYCVLKDACIYYYKNMNSQAAQGMAHLHGYTVDSSGVSGKRFSFTLQPPEPQMRIFFFNAENETDKIRWMDALTKSIQKWIKMD